MSQKSWPNQEIGDLRNVNRKYFTAIAFKVGHPLRLQWLQIHQRS